MRRTSDIRRNTLIFFALGPMIGGLCMLLLVLVSLDYPQALSELFSLGTIVLIIPFTIGGYVVGALPAVASGLLFAFVASRRTLNLMQSVLLGAGAGFLTSAMAVVGDGIGQRRGTQVELDSPRRRLAGWGTLWRVLQRCGGQARPSSSEELLQLMAPTRSCWNPPTRTGMTI